MALIAALVAVVAGCGPTDISEKDAAALLDAMPKVEKASCARVDGREFVCHAAVEDEPFTAHATVSQDGESIVVTECADPANSGLEPWRDPCGSLP